MSLIAVGLNHTTAPLELREKLAVPAPEVPERLEDLALRAGLREVMLLSTCNRVEVYGVPTSGQPEQIIEALAEMRGERAKQFEGHYFSRGGPQAVRHIFSVTASLESMVVGEPQILGQVKEAFRIARERGTVGSTLDRCLTMAFRGAKRVRSETELARGGASISSVAVDLARSIFGSLEGAKVALLGAGEMAQHAAMHLRAAGAGQILVVNRNPERGGALADSVAGRYLPWEQLHDALVSADIVIASTGSKEPVLEPKMMKKVMRARRGRMIFLVDIAVPRDIHPAVAKFDQVFAYDIDDLQQIVNENMAQRGAHAEAARRVIDEEIGSFLTWQRMQELAPTIGRLQEWGQAVMGSELRRHEKRLGELDEAQRQAVESLAHSIVQKMLHRPMKQLRRSVHQDGTATNLDLGAALRSLFELEHPTDDDDDDERDS